MDKNFTYLITLLELNKLITVKHQEECLEHNENYTKAFYYYYHIIINPTDIYEDMKRSHGGKHF